VKEGFLRQEHAEIRLRVGYDILERSIAVLHLHRQWRRREDQHCPGETLSKFSRLSAMAGGNRASFSAFTIWIPTPEGNLYATETYTGARVHGFSIKASGL
jgi:hypothetical protein